MNAHHANEANLYSHRSVKVARGAAHATCDAVEISRAGKVSKASTARAAGRPVSFAGHYGQLLLADGIAPIPRALFIYQSALHLSPQQVWFISYVLSHKWDEDLPHPRLQELARHATLSLR